MSDDEASNHDDHMKINKKSKRISKDDSEDYWVDFGKRHPEKWRELHYLRETIAGRELELKYWRLKLK